LKAFEKVLTRKTKQGELKEKVHLEAKLISPWDFILYVAPKIKKFVKHNFVAQWHDT
jgi:hypothetical protein